MPAEKPDFPRAPSARACPVFILCGGLGTRLRKVESRPKAIIPVAGVPFLTYALGLVRRQGFRRITLLIGHGAEQVQSTFSGPEISYSREPEPLGTGGALALARERAAPLNLILNGDSYADAIYTDLLEAHARRGPEALHGVTLLAAEQSDCGDYGALEVDAEGKVTAFREKGSRTAGWINAGVYLAGGGFFQVLPQGKASLELEILPSLARAGRLWALRGRFFFRDIGTPERLALARREFRFIHNRFAGNEGRRERNQR